MNHEGMKFSLVSRELIADSIEAVVQGHAYDGLVAFGGCDKTLPGAMMGLVRLNVPGVFLYGGEPPPGPPQSGCGKALAAPARARLVAARPQGPAAAHARPLHPHPPPPAPPP